MLSYYPPNLKSKNHPLGSSINLLQKRLMHSFLAGNNTYKAFQDSNKNLETFMNNLAKANNLYLEK